MKKVAFLFPGQGAQYPGMGQDFFEQYPIARQTFEEANDLLGRDLMAIIFKGPEERLTQTRNSQTGIYVMSIALFRVVRELFPELTPFVCSGLSLGEYSGATAAGILPFSSGLALVQERGERMNEACETTDGTMSVVMGLESEVVEKMVRDADLPKDLWIANLNCPGQVVISGTKRGIAVGTEMAKALGAKRVLPLQVHGAFHSGLMQSAEDRLAPHVMSVPLQESPVSIVMNVTGRKPTDQSELRHNLIRQVTSSVRWEQGIREIESAGVDFYLEIGPGKTLAGLNRRIGVKAPTISVENVTDLKALDEQLKG